MNPDPTSLAWWATNFGSTGIAVFMFGLFAWRVLVWSGKRIDEVMPMLKDLLLGHIKLMSVMETHLTEGSKTLLKVSQTQDEHGVMLKFVHENFKRP